MLVIPLTPVPNQAVTTTLGGLKVQLNIAQKWTGLFTDMYVSDVLMLAGVLGRDRRLMVLNAYLGFPGDLMWLDNQGTTDPAYTGIGPDGRYSLVYLEPADIPAGAYYA